LGESESAKATRYISYLDDVILRVSRAVASIPEEDRVTVYYNSAQHGESPLLTCGDGSIVDTWMQVVGCKNVVAGIVKGMDKEVDMEVIIEADPDYILVGGTHQNTAWKTIQTDPAWQGLTAVKEGRMIHNPQGVMKWEKYGVEIALQMQWFAEQMYPGKLDIDIKQTVRDFYRDYYGYDLSEADYADLLGGKSQPGGR
jgi:iron complex transport system substrate-binding protein